jgi:hypothetical protein
MARATFSMPNPVFGRGWPQPLVGNLMGELDTEYINRR